MLPGKLDPGSHVVAYITVSSSELYLQEGILGLLHYSFLSWAFTSIWNDFPFCSMCYIWFPWYTHSPCKGDDLTHLVWKMPADPRTVPGLVTLFLERREFLKKHLFSASMTVQFCLSQDWQYLKHTGLGWPGTQTREMFLATIDSFSASHNTEPQIPLILDSE